MSSSLRSRTPVIDIYVKLAQYPILADKIRGRMREELYRRGIISAADFEREVLDKSVESQRREGIGQSFSQEEASVWELRQERIRDFQTDAYFADNLGTALLEQIIAEVLQNQAAPYSSDEITFNPEIAPWELLFRQGEIYESKPEPEREKVQHHLEEIKVVLIKRMISDHLPYIGVAKRVLSIADLRRVYQRRIGGGKIGGKAAGMLLAWKILQHRAPTYGPDISSQIEMPDSYFIGSEVIYEFSVLNQLDKYMNQKYLPADEIRRAYPQVEAAYVAGELPGYVVERLRQLLEHQIGDNPIAVRSSSLLEGNFQYSLAGKYDSYFLPNQGTPDENLQALLDAVRRMFASTLRPNALLYRRQHNLLDYDERMAILIQKMEGERYGRYFLPVASGVAYSQNPLVWTPEVRREDGFMRLVWGLGTRAVGRAANDYPRLVALSHPTLRPDTSITAVRRYSQKLVDVLDLVEQEHRTLPVNDILHGDYPYLTLIASRDTGDDLQFVPANRTPRPDDRYVVTFEALLHDGRFVKLVRLALRRLEYVYQRPVDIEFTIKMQPTYGGRAYTLNILQCRPLNQPHEEAAISIPADIPDADLLFLTHSLVPNGRVPDVRFIVFVDPAVYAADTGPATHATVVEAIGRLNVLLQDERFILIGPGQWGSERGSASVPISYTDIYHACMLIEIDTQPDDRVPEWVFGTYILKDLVEANIYLLALNAQSADARIEWPYLRDTTNLLPELLPELADLSSMLRVIDVTAAMPDQRADPNRRLHVVMQGQENKAVGYLAAKSEP